MKYLANTHKTAEEPIQHGGNLDVVRARFPQARKPWIDLSTGINPIPFSYMPPLPDAWKRLPSRLDETALLEAAARRYGVTNVETIVAAPGTQALIQLLPRLFSPARVAVLGPTYDEHEACWRRQAHDVRIVRGLDEVADARILIVVNPNNPTGKLLGTDELRGVAAALAERDGLLVVDEAFVDLLSPEAGVCSRLPLATVVLRSFGKVYGLAGLRLGFAVAHRRLAHRIRAELGPWAVSGPALTIGTQALQDDKWLETTRARLLADGERLDALLGAASCGILGGTPLFRLVGHRHAANLAERLGEHGIHVRTFTREAAWLRFGLPGSADEWSRLEYALLSERQ